jgi:hypothetical protein
MAVYADISSVRVTNFMSYKDSTVTFDREGDTRNILKFEGRNDTGKSAFSLAALLVLTNAYYTEHKNYIRSGEEFFRVVLTFVDGVVVVYEKNISGASFYDLYKREGDQVNATPIFRRESETGIARAFDVVQNATRLFSTRFEGEASEDFYFAKSVKEVPYRLQQYFGMLSTSDGLSVNYADANSPKLGVNTTGSENAKILNEVLQARSLTLANERANRHVLDTQAQLASQRELFNVLKEETQRYDQVSQALVSAVGVEREHAMSVQERLQVSSSVAEVVSRAAQVQVLPVVPQVGEDVQHQVSVLASVQQVVQGAVSAVKVPQVPVVDADAVRQMQDSAQVVSLIEQAQSVLVFPQVPQVQYQDVQALEQVSAVVRLCESAAHQVSVRDRAQGEFEQVQQQVSAVVDSLREHGFAVSRCGNCGSVRVVDADGQEIISDEC